METSGGIRASLAGRYAYALFELAQEQSALAAVEGSLTKVRDALAESSDLRTLIESPSLSRDAAGGAIARVGETLDVDDLTSKFLGTLAANRRLDQLPGILSAFGTLVSDHRGVVEAHVSSAHALTDAQMTALTSKLRSRAGRDVVVNSTIDPTLLGGMVVRMGSELIDGSIRTRLNSFAQAMKG